MDCVIGVEKQEYIYMITSTIGQVVEMRLMYGYSDKLITQAIIKVRVATELMQIVSGLPEKGISSEKCVQLNYQPAWKIISKKKTC